MEVELAKQISVSSSALLLDWLVKLKETKYSFLHLESCLRIIVFWGKEIHNPLQSREESTSRFSHMLFVFWFNAVCDGCLLLQIWDFWQFGAGSKGRLQFRWTTQVPLEWALGFYRSPEHMKELLCCSGVCFDCLWALKMSCFNCPQENERSWEIPAVLCHGVAESGHSMVHLFKADTDYVRGLVPQNCYHVKMTCEYLGKDAKIRV